MNKNLIIGILLAIALTLILGPIAGAIALAITLIILVPGLGKTIAGYIAVFVGLMVLVSQFGGDTVMIGLIVVPLLLLVWYFIDKLRTAVSDQPPEPEPEHGLRVESVAPDGLAAGIGLRPGDILQSVDGMTLTTVDDLTGFISRNSGQFCQLTYSRNGKPLSFHFDAGPLGVSLLPC